MPDLSDLISRVEKASGPDRRLDIDIGVALDIETSWYGDLASLGYRSQAFIALGAQPYTASLDAVLTLLPEGMEFELTNLYGVAAVGMGLNTGSPCYARREDGNITLALLAAILRARQTENSHDES